MPGSTGGSPERSLRADLLLGGGAGLLSGCLGVGGGLVLTPVLVLLRHVPQKVAQATALVMVSMTAVGGLAVYAVLGNVAWQAVPLLVIGGLIGAHGGIAVVLRAESRWLQVGFGVLLLAVAVRLAIPGGSTATDPSLPQLSWPQAMGYAVSGVAMGLLSALFGIGGGIMLVPLLVIVMGYPQLLAAGTSLAVMTVIAGFGAYRLSRSGLTDWRAGSRFGAGGIVGSVIGASVAAYVPARILTLLLAVVLSVVGVRLATRGRQSSGDPFQE